MINCCTQYKLQTACRHKMLTKCLQLINFYVLGKCQANETKIIVDK